MTPVLLRKIDALLSLLTPAQKATIRSAFRTARLASEAPALLLADWIRITETAHQHALITELHTGGTLVLPEVRRRRDRQLRQATAACDRAVDALNKAADLLAKHSFAIPFEDLQRQRGLITALLIQLRAAAEHHRLQAAAWPKANRSGNTLRWIPARCMGEVLAAYFRSKHWPVATARAGLFSTVVGSALSLHAMNDQTLRRLSASKLDYAALEAKAPRDVAPTYPTTDRRRLRHSR